MTENGEKPQVEKRSKFAKIFKEYVVSFLLAVLVALTIRHFVIEPFKIPSGSMIPTLLVGDFIFVNKFTYGFQIPFYAKKFVKVNIPDYGEVTFPFLSKRFMKFRDPIRGEVVVFVWPGDKTTAKEDGRKDFIKRVVGVAGDYVEFKDRTIFINNKPVEIVPEGSFVFNSTQGREGTGALFMENLDKHRHPVLFTDASGMNQNFEFLPMKIPEGYFFVMGDNRDNSYDSRGWGLVPLDNLKGRALFIWFSIDKMYDKIYDVVRWKRLFSLIK